MLSYKLLQNNNNSASKFQEIDVQDFYITLNKTFIGGYIDNLYGLYNSKTIYLWVKNLSTELCDNRTLFEHKLITEQVQIQGKVTFNTQLQIFHKEVYNLNDNSTKFFKYVKYRGFIVTSAIPSSLNIDNVDENYIVHNDTPIINQIVTLLNQASDSDKTILLSNDYVYVENGKFVYNGTTYEQDKDFYLLSNLNNQTIIANDGNLLNIDIWEDNLWEDKTKFTVPLFTENNILKINTILRVNNMFYNDSEGLNFYSQITPNSFLNSNQTIFYQSYKKLSNNCIVNSEEQNGNIYKYIVYNNKRYYALTDLYYAFQKNNIYYHIIISKEIQTINGVLCYTAYYNDKGIVYVQKDDMTKGFISSTDDNLATTSWKEIYIENIPSIIINEDIYPIYPTTTNLNIFEYKEGQLILLKLNNDSSMVYTLLSSNLNEVEQTFCTEVFFNDVNNNSYWFFYNNLPTYNFNINGNRYITSIDDFSAFAADNEIDDTFFGGREISLLKNNDKYQVTLPLSIDLSDNQNQEYIVQSNFFDKENESSINFIIDMEKDIYYPCVNNGTNKCEYKQNMSLCNDIVFNLHFRTRDLNTWEINTDRNWFVSDYYDTFNINRSDLLGFLKFNDKDVFYQKNKLKKSFLRLSFYDSPNPTNQNLLYYSTVFIDERNLYNKYIKNINTIEEQTFVNILTNTSLANISVNSEYQNKNNLTEDKRLSCQLRVNNMFQTTSSSDGYYIYLYRDFTSPFESRSIYMKAEFNHAGLGRTLQFMLPRNFSVNGQALSHLTISKAITNSGEEFEVSPLMPNTLLDNNNNEYSIESNLINDINNFSSGFDIQDIYYQQYVEFKIIYDEKNKRFCYYLPFNSYVDNNMILNLFELKLK